MTEIEIRAIITKEQFESLIGFCSTNFKKVKKDDLIVTYYWPHDNNPNNPNQTIKIAKNQITSNARVVSKVKNVSGEQEFEIFTDNDTAHAIDKLLYLSNIGKRYENIQQREDFELVSDGVTFGISMKYSTDWQYHMEIDTLISNPEDTEKVKSTKEKILSLYEEFGVKPLSAEEETLFNKNLLANRKQDTLTI
jgi:hypothetical protein